jgi:hypothetical protein
MASSRNAVLVSTALLVGSLYVRDLGFAPSTTPAEAPVAAPAPSAPVAPAPRIVLEDEDEFAVSGVAPAASPVTTTLVFDEADAELLVTPAVEYLYCTA